VGPAPGGQPAPAPTTAPPPAALALPATTPDPLSTSAVADFGSAAFLQSLLDILAHPLGNRHPDLHHFRLPDEGTLTTVSGDGDLPVRTPIVRVRPPLDGRTIAVEVLAPAALLLVAVAGRRRMVVAPVPRGLWLVLGGAVVTTALASAVTGAAPPAHLVDATATGPASAGMPVPPVPGPDHPGARPAAARPWDQLVALEERLAEQSDRLTVLEADFRTVLSSDVEPVGLNQALLRPSRLARLVAAHEEDAAAYRRCLETEYDLYRVADDDPQQRLSILRGAAAMPGSSATEAVTYNLQVIGTQLAQERQIARAVAILARYAASAEGPLQAIGQHRPFIVPETAPLTQAFGPTEFTLEPPLVYRGSFYSHFHTGIDLAGPLDSPLHAAADGVVLLATSSRDAGGRLVGYGNYVLIGHPDGFATLYGHMDRVLVTEGMVVRQGQVIGLEGSTGWSTGPHVHFEIRYGRELLDPLPLLSQAAG
jgi:murein DD-endopeptidase MepM/ murein hydrolase activator NlpD